ncbi:MAG: sugar ABC transporter ATP-binding protein [Proteobacteria bacterium]|nr:sugar ABC transporter ATP-binding protein [Pseudomonadota bacterium]
MLPAGEIILGAFAVTKDFPGVRALENMDFDLRSGEVHVLFGENGAGKSTLISIFAGALRPDSGRIEIGGESVHLHSVHDARAKGISAMFQEFSLAPDLTVEENIMLGAEPSFGPLINRRALRTKVRAAIDRYGFGINPREVVARLSRAEQQMVEMTKALLTNPKILILDEPTASLTERETRVLFALIDTLKSQGVGIIYITHRIAEIQEVGDRVTVMRDGHHIETLSVHDLQHKHLVELMTGREVGNFFPTISFQPGEVRLRVGNLTTRDGRVRDVSIEVRAGEIVGLAGLVGCGKSEIGRACFGAVQLESGEIEFLGKIRRRPTPKNMLRSRLCYVPSDRRNEGLMLQRATRENIALSALELPILSRFGLLRRYSERTTTRALAERMQVRPLELENDVLQYSGGNQQKILVAKSLARETDFFIFDEPTIGIDVGSKTEVYNFLKELVAEGVGILLISSELPEITNLCNRVYVIHAGQVRSHLSGGEITEPNILASFFADEGAAERGTDR